MGARGLGSRAIIGEFFEVLEQDVGPIWIPLVGNLFTSDQESEEYKWLGQVPSMRPWVGGRQATKTREQGFIIKNLRYEATLEILKDDLDRDKTGQIMLRVGELARRTNAHWGKLLSQLILDGAGKLAYDGQFFFDTDHKEAEEAAQSNMINFLIADVDVQKPTVGEMENLILKAVEQMLKLHDDRGEPINEDARQFLVMVGPQYFFAAAAAMKNPIVLDGGGPRTNTLVNLAGYNFELAVNSRLLPATDKVFVFRTDAGFKSFIRQQETEVELEAQAEGSPIEFNERKHQYGVTASRNVGYGFWQHAVQVTLTT